MVVLRGDHALPGGLAEIAAALELGFIEATDVADAQSKFLAANPDIFVLPALFAERSTLPLVQLCRKRNPACQAIMLVEPDQINEAAEAMRAGILDCLFLPFSNERLAKTLAAAMGRLGVEVEPEHLERAHREVPPAAPSAPAPAPSAKANAADLNCAQGETQVMQKLSADLETARKNRLPVVLLGEAGCGKSHCAAAIHADSADGNSPYYKLDCAALTPETLPEEISASTTRATFYFDELTDLSPRVQARLVRLLGDDGPPQARLISATSHEPIKAINSGALRRDLYYRLCVGQIHIPPLRARGNDILLIAQDKLRQYAALEGAELRQFSAEATEYLLANSWPGNIRQLSNMCRNLVMTYGSKGVQVVEADMLPDDIVNGAGFGGATTSHVNNQDTLAALFRGQSLAAIERRVIEAVIEDHDGSVTQAARSLMVAPSTLYRKREQWAREDSQ